MFERHPLRFLRNLNRTRQIFTVFLRFGFEDVLDRLPLKRYVQWGTRLLFRRPVAEQTKSGTARRLRLALESLGPTFIKFGQVISTRPDIVPANVIEELSHLREKVPPFPSEIARARLEEEFGGRLDTLFASFDDTPVAAGSLAQVHRATLHDGTPIAIKIRRPGAPRLVERDLSLMTELAALVDRSIAEAKPFDPNGLVHHFARTIRRELDFAREGRSLEEFSRLFQHDASLYVPRVYWQFTSEAVLTMEYIEGLPVDDPELLRDRGIRPEHVAANGARIFMKQAFELGLFHGDPHPGNLRVLRDGSLCLLDYGMVGMLDEERRDRLVDLLIAISRQDVREVVHVVLSLGEKRDPADEYLLRADINEFIKNYYGIPLEHLRVGQMLTDFVGILGEHQIRCPPNLLLLIRSLVTLEGVGRQLDPKFNLAQHLAPFMERIVKERYNVRSLLHRAVREGRTWMTLAHEIPVNLGNTLERLSRNELAVKLQHEGLSDFKSEVDRVSNRIVIAVVVSSLIVASALIIHAGRTSALITVPIYVLSSLLGIWLIYGVFRSGRL